MISDNPILTKEKDLLRRYPLAIRIAEMINGFDETDSFVIGIEGEWGSGKTSFINLILEELRESDALIIKFNPWNFSDQNELIKDFFNSLIESIKQSSSKQNDDRVKKIKEYSSKLLKQSELEIKPEISILGVLKFKLGEFHKFGIEEPLEKQKEIVNEILKGLGRRIIVVIDDIDRLDQNETKLIFKLVKITGNFSNTIFILAYDRGRICTKINEQEIGEEYLKKIIQVSFTLPKPDPQDLLKILFSDIDSVIKDFDDKYWDEVRWGNLFHSGFNKLFPTIRDIKRYISSLSLDLEVIGKEEINPIDFLGIEAIRVFTPQVYLAMTDEKRAFTTTDSYFLGFNDTKERDTRKTICEEVIGKSPSNLTEFIKDIIKNLFPQVKGLYSNTQYGNDWQQQWRQQLMVCSEDMFDKYFSLSVPSSTLSEKSLKDLLSTVSETDSFTENLKKFQKEDKLRLVLDRLLDYLDELNDQHKENMLIAVFDYAENLKDRKRGLFDLQDVDSLVLRLGYKISKRILKEKRVDFILKILEETESIFSPIHFVSVLNQELEKMEKKESQEDPLLTKEEVEIIKKKCLEKIKNASRSNILQKNKAFIYILGRWKEWESEESVREYISEILKTDDGLFDFLNGFVSESLSQGAEDLVPRRIKRIDKKTIEHFIDIQELNKQVESIDESSLDNEKADLIKLFKKPEKDRFGED